MKVTQCLKNNLPKPLKPLYNGFGGFLIMKIAMTRSVKLDHYLVTGDVKLINLVDDLPVEFELKCSLSEYKHNEMRYFSPVILKEGLERRKSNIKFVTAIVLDLDNIPDTKMFYRDLNKLNVADYYVWKTISNYSDEGHTNGRRLVFELREPIYPYQLENASKKMIDTFKRMGFDATKYGLDTKAMIDPARLSGFALSQTETYHNIGKTYRVDPNTKAVDTTLSTDTRGEGVDDPEKFIKNYIRKHNVPKPVLGVNVHFTLQRLIGVLYFAGVSEKDALEALLWLSKYTTNGEEDIEREIQQNPSYKSLKGRE